MKSINLDGVPINIEIVRSRRRKTVSIVVEPDCTVRVLAPVGVRESTLLQFLNQKQPWISSKLDYFHSAVQKIRLKEYRDGEEFVLLGRSYTLKTKGSTECKAPIVNLEGSVLVLSYPIEQPGQGHGEQARETLLQWYHEYAHRYLVERTKELAKIIQVAPVEIWVKSYKRRWGACDSLGRIRYNWRIIIAPEVVVDYLIIHELCHLVHPNHSKKYWALVVDVMPEYKVAKEWLRKNSALLHL